MKTHYFIGCLGISLLFLGSCRMPTPTPGVEEALSEAGGNRNELYQVIRHYQENGEDSLKLNADLFLIENQGNRTKDTFEHIF